MVANYHTHTYRCRHASGTEEAYVRAAIDMGLEIFGFSDHTPYWFAGDYYSNFRMFPEQLPDYVDTVLALRKAYEEQIQIPLGLEMEYYPAYFQETLEKVRDAGIEYLLLGQHFVGNEIGEHYSGRFTDDTAILKKYCYQVADAMHTGLFSYLAHPDLIYYTGSRKAYLENMRLICRAAKECDLPLEVNLLGLREGRNYPNIRFWEMAAQEGCQVVFGCDAHRPENVTDPTSEKIALEMVNNLGLELLETVALRKV